MMAMEFEASRLQFIEEVEKVSDRRTDLILRQFVSQSAHLLLLVYRLLQVFNFWTVIVVRKSWAQRDSAEKTSKFGLNTIRRRTQGAPYAAIGSLQDLIKTAQNL